MEKIHYAECNYSEAIKMYRMGLDQILQKEKIGVKVYRNTGNAFVNIGKYHNTIHHYESAMSSSPDHKTGVNVMVYFFVLGDVEKVSGVLPQSCRCS